MTWLYENAVARVGLDDTVPCLVFEWVGPIHDQAAFRDVILCWLHSLQVLRDHVPAGQPLGVLVDNRHAQLIDPADQEWMADYITPRQLEAGLRFVAIVDDQSPESHHNINEWRLRADLDHQPLVVVVYNDETRAREWLRLVFQLNEGPAPVQLATTLNV